MSNSHSEFTMYKTEFLISPKPALPAVFPISANGYTSLIHMLRSKALESTLTPLSLTYSIQLTTTLIIKLLIHIVKYLLCASQCSKSFVCLVNHIIFIWHTRWVYYYILLLRKPKHKECKLFKTNHEVKKWQSQCLNPDSLVTEPMLLSSM